MHIYSVYDPEFRPYGKVLEGYVTTQLCAAMSAFPLPEEGTAYQPSIPELESCAIFGELTQRFYGGMPTQLGMCWGHNTRLNCLEYHRDSEVNVGTHDFVLLLGREQDIVGGKLHTDTVMAFRVPAGVAVEVYATTLHYAPCHTDAADGFRVAVALPRGTNTPRPDAVPPCQEDNMLWACNKWLLAHPDAKEAKRGAHIGLEGPNIDIAND